LTLRDILPSSRISRRSTVASLYIKDPETADRVRAMARRLGSTQTEVVRRGLLALERELPGGNPAQKPDFVA
jgi:hypothetical protein